MKIQNSFSGYVDRAEGDDRSQIGVIQGSLIKFTNDANWVCNGEELSPDLELVVFNVARVVQKWLDQQPIETRILEPGAKFPDLEQLNNDTPRSEWTESPDGQPRGPWQAQRCVYLLNLKTMDRYTWPTGTIGGAIAVRDLVERIQWMQKCRDSDDVYPVVTLSDTLMKTKHGPRQRPHFLIMRWVYLGGGGDPALPAPTQPALIDGSATNKPTEKVSEPERPTTTKRGVQYFDKPTVKTVDGPTLKEELDDDIPI
jgi:hypothetical protein